MRKKKWMLWAGLIVVLAVVITGEVGRCRLVHITVTGLHHPLREPYVPLSEYTALLLFVRKNSL
ncbi:hypothetical protein ACFOUX_03230, partial [Lactococcus lactis subsp. hordniae]